MQDVEPHGSERFEQVVAVVLMLLCVAMSGVVIAGASTVIDGIMMVAVTAVAGLLYGLLAVRAELRAEREREAGRSH